MFPSYLIYGILRLHLILQFLNNSNILFFSVLKKMDASKFVLIGLVLTICAFICQLIGLASPYWIYIDLGETKAYGGLWKSCLYNKTFDTTLCDEMLDVLGIQLSLILIYSSVLLSILNNIRKL